MTILVTGATGNVGGKVVEQLVQRGADVRALVRDPAKANFPSGATVVRGDLLDPQSLRQAFQGVSTLFLLNAVVPDEFTQALIALNIAQEKGIENIVYLSVLHGERYINAPHLGGKLAVERVMEDRSLNATILRAAYFIDNEVRIKDTILDHGIYPMPIGTKGLAMVDSRDIAEVAALELLRRDASDVALPLDRINLVGPDTLTGHGAAAIWSDVLSRQVTYPGEDLDGFEQTMGQFQPGWMAYDMRLMADGFIREGMQPEPGDVDRLTRMLGRPLHTYRDYVAEITRSS